MPDLGDDLSEGEIEIKDEDLEVSTMRSGGAGGQHVNRTESAVRMKHIPTGFVVRCEAERSQHQNRETALKMLRGLLFEKARREREEEAFEEAFLNDRADIAFGSQVRTYTLQPYTMVKDERTDHKANNADGRARRRPRRVHRDVPADERREESKRRRKRAKPKE